MELFIQRGFDFGFGAGVPRIDVEREAGDFGAMGTSVLSAFHGKSIANKKTPQKIFVDKSL
jgi:hypothetical protein